MRKLVITTLSSLVLASTIFANCGNKAACPTPQACDTEKKSKHYSKNSCDSNYKKSHKQKKFLYFVSQLELTDKQEMEITKILDEYKNQKQSAPCDAFSKDSFDKQKFVNEMVNKKKNHIQAKANMMEKVYNTLTIKQKAKLRVMMNEHKKSKGSCSDKNCNGRG
jgi:Spy/CpxP family protein refolding chaperone